MDQTLLCSYDALIPFAVLTGLVAVPLGLMYLVYPKSILLLYLRYVYTVTIIVYSHRYYLRSPLYIPIHILYCEGFEFCAWSYTRSPVEYL